MVCRIQFGQRGVQRSDGVAFGREALPGDLVAVPVAALTPASRRKHQPPLRPDTDPRAMLVRIAVRIPCASAQPMNDLFEPRTAFVLVDTCPGWGSNPHDPKVRGV